MGPQSEQLKGTPYIFYQRLASADLKPTGVRMAALFAMCDNNRTDMFTTCDMSVEAYRKVNDPFVEVAMELRPAIKQLAADVGLGARNRSGRGSWLRSEASSGWPQFPFKTEEQSIFFVGQDKNSVRRETICTARFVEAFTDKDEDKALNGDDWAQAAEQYWKYVKQNHSDPKLSEMRLSAYYKEGSDVFQPTKFAKVTWMMSHFYSDAFDILYHGKTSEMIWEVNMQAGGAFADLVATEPDPQAIAVNLPKMMKVSEVYEVLCFLEESTKRAIYVLAPQGKMDAANVVLGVCTRYKWDNISYLGETLTKEDFQLITGASARGFIQWATGEDGKGMKNADLSLLSRP